ncbi:hypothetical protein SAMN05443247_01963 [Bradyrhizobium erythrophlei]|jgi:hypothetical protein|nr:hypothetical protein SAMN05443247_01963 [Bradyrhizobium erythrophlei]
MISPRAADPRRQTSLASISGPPCFASLARFPDRSTPCRPASAEASNRAVGPASNPFPSGLLPSGLGMAKPTIPQARDRAEVVSGATRPEWVTSAGSLERLVTGARNGLTNVCSRPWLCENVKSCERWRIYFSDHAALELSMLSVASEAASEGMLFSAICAPSRSHTAKATTGPEFLPGSDVP